MHLAIALWIFIFALLQRFSHRGENTQARLPRPEQRAGCGSLRRRRAMRRAERHRQMAVSHRDVALYMLDSALPPDDPVSATRGFCVSHKRPMLNHRTAG